VTIDPGMAAIGAAAIAAISGGIGAVVAYVLEGRRIASADRRQEALDRAERVRRMELLRIDHTRREVERTRHQVMAMRSGESAVIPFADILERSDLRLIGDVAAATAFVAVTRRIADECMSELMTMGAIVGRPLTSKEQNDLADLRVAVMDALDAQERRALRDEPLIVLKRV
jgi:hypothetical protein